MREEVSRCAFVLLLGANIERIASTNKDTQGSATRRCRVDPANVVFVLITFVVRNRGAAGDDRATVVSTGDDTARTRARTSNYSSRVCRVRLVLRIVTALVARGLAIKVNSRRSGNSSG